MWSYYGRKSKVIHHYPEPQCDTIIEPFAGTAVYALHNDNWQRNVVLRDVNPLVIRLWKWLQTSASPDLIMCIPDIGAQQKVPEHLPTEAGWLWSFYGNRGSEAPRKTSGTFDAKKPFGTWPYNREKIAASLHKIKHWDIALGDYSTVPNIRATWFIDPPYQTGGDRYKYCDPIDYQHLAEWCQSRRGQVIVCENGDADWLDFQPLVAFRGQTHSRQEVVWTRSLHGKVN